LGGFGCEYCELEDVSGTLEFNEGDEAEIDEDGVAGSARTSGRAPGFGRAGLLLSRISYPIYLPGVSIRRFARGLDFVADAVLTAER
jgi:hypothetical protein